MFYSSVNILAKLIINQYFLDSRCLLIFRNEQNSFNYVGEIPTAKFNEISKSVFKYFGCQGIILQSENPVSDVVNLEKLIRLEMERFNQRKYLLIPGENMKENLSDVLLLNELNYVSDFLIISPPDQIHGEQNLVNNIIFNLITHKYVGYSDHNEPILLDKWFAGNQSFLYKNNLYPNKLTNQLGRPLRMATFNYEPYSVYGGINNSYGSELTTAVQFALKHNMTPTAVINEKDYWGEIYKNWTGNGLMGNLAIDKADVGFGALYTWEISYHYLDLSKPTVRTGITCIVPAPKLAAGWFTPLLSFSYHLWKAVGITFLVVILVTSLFTFFYNRNKLMRKKYHKEKQFNFLKLLGSSIMLTGKPFVTQSLSRSEIPMEISGKFLILLVFMLNMFLSSTYSSGLASIMTIPRYEDPIDTVEDFARSDLHWGATQEAWITSIEKVEESVYVKIVNNFVADSEANLRKYSLTGKFALSIERLPYDNYAIQSYIKKDVIDNFHLMRQDFYWEQCLMMTKKSSILLPSLDLFILRTFEAGLIWYWQNEAVHLFMDTDVQQTVKYYSKHSKETPVVKLKWIHVEGAFGLLCIGYCLSLVIFFWEILYFKMIIKKKQ